MNKVTPKEKTINQKCYCGPMYPGVEWIWAVDVQCPKHGPMIRYMPAKARKEAIRRNVAAICIKRTKRGGDITNCMV